MHSSVNIIMIIDIDECAEGIEEPNSVNPESGSGEAPSTVRCHHLCNNTIGGYQCECREGYFLDPEDNSTCFGKLLLLQLLKMINYPVTRSL